jgi:predicted metal-dependent phosphoesterase TrpH
MKIAADLHIHSTLSPCAALEMSPAAIVRRARELALDMIAVTDHNRIANGLTAARLGETAGVKVLLGMEAQTREDIHILCQPEERSWVERFNERICAALPAVSNNLDFSRPGGRRG